VPPGAVIGPVLTEKTAVCEQLMVRIPNGVLAVSVWLLLVVAVKLPGSRGVIVAAEALAATTLNARTARTPTNITRKLRDMLTPDGL
jgi:hypothetical protein